MTCSRRALFLNPLLLFSGMPVFVCTQYASRYGTQPPPAPEQQAIYPNLSKMALNLLSIPAFLILSLNRCILVFKDPA
jgi:hypothetical protein